jgi:predicted TIM-barrel fold metal-dependent hydrolase
VIVDLHVHYYPPAYVEAIQAAPTLETYRRDDGRIVALWRGGVALAVPQPHPGVAERIEMMDQLGISMQVLSVPSPSAYFVDGEPARRVAAIVNDDFAEIVRGHPDRFHGFAALPLKDVDSAIAELERATSELGLAGAMLLTNVDGELLDAPRLEPFWERASELGALLYVHPTAPAVTTGLEDYGLAIALGFFADTNLALARLTFSGVFERHRGIRWVFSHAGGTIPFMLPRLDNYYDQFPQCREHIARPPSAILTELTYDTATTHVPALRCTCDTFGVDRLVFGSDYPHIPGGTGPYLDAIKALDLPKDQRTDVLGGRAVRLLRSERI